ncbi:MAG: aspartate--tRNA ligase [Zhaonellaceae bacterium]|jgi:aspartyl-tRNA synthetase|nr:aspartate--tRNA ligase [Clostridia bacterium]
MAEVESMAGLKRTHLCGKLSLQNLDEEVVLMGWVHRRRDHGGLIFIDLRDRYGIVQIVFNPDLAGQAFSKAEEVRNEYVLAVKGKVTARPSGTINPNLTTGEIEIYATDLKILNKAKTPPFYISDDVEVDETIRLKYRYLDLRRTEMQKSLILRHKTTKAIRDFLDKHNFLEIETPMLTKSSPEGARDYLVPSRVNPGEFYALPQSPQLFKQILMVAGMDRYFQIARCFRDEDLRADRQPEFTQLDMEISFSDRETIITLVEEMMQYIFKETLNLDLSIPFPRLTYYEAMERFGSDKPDLRFKMELVDISDLVKSCNFKVFQSALATGGKVKGINAEGCGNYPRRQIDDLTKLAISCGSKGLAWIALTDEGLKSPIAKFLTEEELNNIIKKMGGKQGDLLLFVADSPSVVATVLGHLRLEFGKRLNLINPEEFNFSWIIDFPLLEWDPEEKRYVAIHHPFTAPLEADLDLLESEPDRVRAQAYDLVLNGVELGGGSIRIHNRSIQEKMFKLLGLTKEQSLEKFGYLLEAFEYGTPPHGGIAFGLDRMIMLMARKDTIRDVIAFPKTQSASDLMTQAPSPVEPKQLKELHIKLDIVTKKSSDVN